ncbi:CAP domain-containing protein [Ruminococcus albus]|uniref:Uncharacterized protein n=1 Tax=Ruminococcus albus TaxID=1264 RepID=A0A1H7L6G5_RUMAL|nr:CAP domain-containing protein [Ruminococcus albus]SEK94591.1 hypothetical protein SAMN05216469_10877 [Ruminococcus albus]
MVRSSLKLWIGIAVIVVVVFSGLLIKYSLRRDPLSIERSGKSLSEKGDGMPENDGLTTDAADVVLSTDSDYLTTIDSVESQPEEEAPVVTQSTEKVDNRRKTETTTTKSTKDVKEEKLKKAKKELEAASEKFDKAGEKLDQCNQALEDAKSRRDQLQGEYDNAKSKYEESKRNYDESQKENFNKGMLGFFESIGDHKGIETLNDSDLVALANMGDSADATSLECMKRSIDYLNFINQIRKAEGKPEVKVSCKLMALAALNNDLYAADNSNSNPTDLDEDLAIGFDDPFTIWYYDEKDDEGGNYLSLVNEEHIAAGFAYSHKNGNVHNVLFCDKGYDAGRMMPVSEFAEKFNAYYETAIKGKSYSGAEEAMKHAESALNSAKQAVTDKEKAAQSASSAYGSAKTVFEQKQNAVDELE